MSGLKTKYVKTLEQEIDKLTHVVDLTAEFLCDLEYSESKSGNGMEIFANLKVALLELGYEIR